MTEMPPIDRAYALAEVREIKADIAREWRRLRKALRGLRIERSTLLEYVSRPEIAAALGTPALDEIGAYARRVRRLSDRMSATADAPWRTFRIIEPHGWCCTVSEGRGVTPETVVANEVAEVLRGIGGTPRLILEGDRLWAVITNKRAKVEWI